MKRIMFQNSVQPVMVTPTALYRPFVKLRENITYTDDGISPALPATVSGFGSGFCEVLARHGGSGGLTGGRMIVCFSPGGRTLLKQSVSPRRESNSKDINSYPNKTLSISIVGELGLAGPCSLFPISSWLTTLYFGLKLFWLLTFRKPTFKPGLYNFMYLMFVMNFLIQHFLGFIIQCSNILVYKNWRG